MTPSVPHRLHAAAFVIAVACVIGLTSVAAMSDAPLQIPGPMIAEPADEYRGFTYVGRAPVPDGMMAAPNSAARPATFVVTYNTAFPPAARTAFEHALSIWGSVLHSRVPIRVTANFRTELSPYFLASSGAAAMLRDFPNAPKPNTYYPVALANSRAGYDLTSNEEIVANFNAFFDWYFGLDGAAGERFDLVTVALHEIGHGLGFVGSLRTVNGVGSWGVGWPPLPMGYDTFVKTTTGQRLLDGSVFPNGSTTLGAALTSESIRFEPTDDSRAAQLFAPNPWLPGSSIAHLNDNAYPRGDINSLMTPSVGPGEVIHDPGPIARAMLVALGWATTDGVGVEPVPAAPRNLRVTLRR
ncbi:MAG: hypothetical protein FJW27_01285 [Acidimicrobiia bacterium]|nr:hypothetical protein [Acidimicrobiia bacterium]